MGRANMKPFPCHQVHFRPVIFPWTNPAKGNCSFLDTCRNLNRCDHIHYELDDKPADFDNFASPNGTKKPPVPSYLQVINVAQALCFLAPIHVKSRGQGDPQVEWQMKGVEECLLFRNWATRVGWGFRKSLRGGKPAVSP